MNDADWYDYPRYYDFVFDTETRQEADFIEQVIDRYLNGNVRRLLEPGCGSGRLVRELAGRGYHVTGFDINRSMIEFARRSSQRYSRKTTVLWGHLENFTLQDKYDLAYCFIDTFRYLTTEETARSHLQCMVRALRPGGIYLLGLHLTKYTLKKCERERSIRKKEDLTVICNLQSWPPDRKKRVQKFRARMNIDAPDGTRNYETEWMFRTYGPRQIAALFNSIPHLRHIDTYSFDYDLHSSVHLGAGRLDCVFILKRK
jgi:SAM-dependent methyltransferase